MAPCYHGEVKTLAWVEFVFYNHAVCPITFISDNILIILFKIFYLVHIQVTISGNDMYILIYGKKKTKSGQIATLVTHKLLIKLLQVPYHLTTLSYYSV